MRKYVAELVGTFVLVFGGVGSAVLAGAKIGNVGVAFAFGLALLWPLLHRLDLAFDREEPGLLR